MRLTGGLSASAYFLAVSLWMPSSRAIARRDRPPEFSLLDGFPYVPLTRGGLSVRFRSGFVCPPGPVYISCFHSCQPLLREAVGCHAPLALAASLCTGGICPEQTRSPRCLLGGDDLPQILHGYRAFQVLVYFHLQPGVAGAIRTRQQLERSRAVLDGVVSGHPVCCVCPANRPIFGVGEKGASPSHRVSQPSRLCCTDRKFDTLPTALGWLRTNTRASGPACTSVENSRHYHIQR